MTGMQELTSLTAMTDLRKLLEDTEQKLSALNEISCALKNYTDYLTCEKAKIPFEIAECLLWYEGELTAKELGYSLDKEAKELCKCAAEILQKRFKILARELEDDAVHLRVVEDMAFGDVLEDLKE